LRPASLQNRKLRPREGWFELGAYTLSYSTALFCEGVFWDRVSQTICLGWLWTTIFLICASWVARVTGMKPQASGLVLILYSKSWNLPGWAVSVPTVWRSLGLRGVYFPFGESSLWISAGCCVWKFMGCPLSPHHGGGEEKAELFAVVLGNISHTRPSQIWMYFKTTWGAC
jgi:hypothetical protein